MHDVADVEQTDTGDTVEGRVRMIFQRYLELGSIGLLLADLRERGIVTKVRHLSDGRTVGGIPFTRGPLTAPDNTNNVLAIAFGILIVLLLVVGSAVIMANLNANLMPSAEVMNMQIQH
jgi:hypothetical protein